MKVKQSCCFFLVVITIFLFLLSCKKGNDEFPLFKEAILYDSTLTDLKLKKFLIIPGSGCEGCISQAESYVIRMAKHQPEIGFIFTNIKSEKMLRLRLGEKLTEKSNIIFDPSNKLFFRSIYPIYVEVSLDAIIVQKELKGKLLNLD
ncbi:MAG TPA: hypothetical protein PKC76_11420 [Saprospiraceae bacterium]|nr:hypothetical protein [Saprospiraceae bacterium]HMP24736.1 hypothetical protein [Saprospiraceae bacterium]